MSREDVPVASSHCAQCLWKVQCGALYLTNTPNRMTMNEDAELLDIIVRALVDFPDAVSVERSVDEMGVLLKLKVHKDDMGKVIGKAGNMAKAIRTLMRGIGMKKNARVNIKILEPMGSVHTPPNEVVAGA